MKQLLFFVLLIVTQFSFGQSVNSLTVADIENLYCVSDISTIGMILKSKKYETIESNGTANFYIYQSSNGQTKLQFNKYSNYKGFSEIYIKSTDTTFIKQFNNSCVTYGYDKLKSIGTTLPNSFHWQKDIQLVGTKVRFVVTGSSSKTLDYKFFIEVK